MNLDDGLYDFVGGVVRAFRSLNVDAEHIAAFQKLAGEVDAGSISAAAAMDRVRLLPAPLIELWARVNSQAGAISIVLSIIALYLAYSANLSSDVAAAKQLEAAEKQTEVTRMIYTELQKQTALAREQAARLAPTTPMRTPSQPQTIATRPNRHERLKAAALERRQRR